MSALGQKRTVQCTSSCLLWAKSRHVSCKLRAEVTAIVLFVSAHRNRQFDTPRIKVF
jgi:hypothetical protein